MPNRSANIQQTELGRERLCTKCQELWPDDSEFFHLKAGKTVQPCKACYAQLPSRVARTSQKREPARVRPALINLTARNYQVAR